MRQLQHQELQQQQNDTDNKTHLPVLAVSISGLVRLENLTPQEHEKEVVRRGRRLAPRRSLLQIGPHRRQARCHELFRLDCHELIG